MIHLTETGFHAGRRLCLTPRHQDDGSFNVHAAYAPLRDSDFRDDCCAACLKTWANEAYDVGDDMPGYITALRAA
jgi:hypothetical protein